MTSTTSSSNGPSSNDSHENLLWEAGRRLADDPAAIAEAHAPSNAELEAYRRQELSAEDTNRVEAALLASSELRRRLAELAGLEGRGLEGRSLEGLDAAELRQRVLDGFAEAMARREDAPESRDAAPSVVPFPVVDTDRETPETGPRDDGRSVPLPAWSRRALGTWLAAAAALVLVVLLPLWQGGLFDDAEPLPEGAAWQLSAEGLATVRGEAAQEPALLELRPETWLRLDASPEIAIDDVEFGIFRQSGDVIERLHPDPSQVRIERGAVRIETETAALLGSEAHRGRLLLVAARTGQLPTAQELLPSDGSGPTESELYRVYTLDYEVLDD
jgi:hypothetical protein